MSTQPFLTLRRLTATLAPLLLVGALATACGGEADPEEQAGAQPSAASGEPSAEPSTGAPTEPAPETDDAGADPIEVTLEEGAYSPLGERVEVEVGEPVVISVTADAPGSLHVHSTPEQEITFEAGASEHEIVLDRPGVVEVESHEPAPALVILQLEAR